MLLVGDVVGSPGRETLKRCLSLAREQHHIDVCLANGENAAGGFGLTAQTADEMFESGVDFITSGNHIFDKRDFKEYLERLRARRPPGKLSPVRRPGAAPVRSSSAASPWEC